MRRLLLPLTAPVGAIAAAMLVILAAALGTALAVLVSIIGLVALPLVSMVWLALWSLKRPRRKPRPKDLQAAGDLGRLKRTVEESLAVTLSHEESRDLLTQALENN